jgi:hypothetical protein
VAQFSAVVPFTAMIDAIYSFHEDVVEFEDDAASH